MVSRTAATFIALFAACCFAESIQKTVCVPNTDKCVNIEYEPCTTELVIGGNLIPGDGVSLSLASNVSKCVDVDTSQIIDIAGSLGIDTSQLELFEQLNPQICIALSDVHVEDGEKASFNFKVYVHASKKLAGIQIPDVVLPGMDRSYDLGHLCYGKSAASCNGACGYCADSGTCMLGNRDGPLCKTCSSGYTWAPPAKPSHGGDSSPGGDTETDDSSPGGDTEIGKGHSTDNGKGSDSAVDGASDSDNSEGGGHHSKRGGGAGGVILIVIVILLLGGVAIGAGWFLKRRHAQNQHHEIDGMMGSSMWGSDSAAYDPANVQTPVVVQGRVVHSAMGGSEIAPIKGELV